MNDNLKNMLPVDMAYSHRKVMNLKTFPQYARDVQGRIRQPKPDWAPTNRSVSSSSGFTQLQSQNGTTRGMT